MAMWLPGTLEMADEILQEINNLDIFDGVKKMDFEQGLKDGMIAWIGEDCVTAFLDDVQTQSVLGGTDGSLKIVYTPLNGSGKMCVTRILERIGVTDVTIVPNSPSLTATSPLVPSRTPRFAKHCRRAWSCAKR